MVPKRNQRRVPLRRGNPPSAWSTTVAMPGWTTHPDFGNG
jgi:hypothetical protein